MFNTESTLLVSSSYSKTQHENTECSKSKPTKLKDTTNTKKGNCRFDKVIKCRGEQQSIHQVGGEYQSIDVGDQPQYNKENQVGYAPKLKKQFLSFECQEEKHQQAKKHANIINDNSQKDQIEVNLEKVIQQERFATKDTKSSEWSSQLCHLGYFDQKTQKNPPKQEFQAQRELQYGVELQNFNFKQIENIEAKQISNHHPLQKSKQLLRLSLGELEWANQGQQLQLQAERCQLEQKVQSNQSITQNEPANNIRMVIRFAGLVTRFGSSYHLQPIPYGAVFECIVKRDRCDSGLKYQLFDCFSLRNFMTVFKDDYGYLIVSQNTEKGTLGAAQSKEIVVGRVVSNFFGNEFDCSLENLPYFKGNKYPVKENAERLVTVEYQTNIFGLKGPRKMSAYIPIHGEKKYQHLGETYQKQAKNKLKSTVLKFKNKAPKWSRELNGYVLNFGGRATVSSIKNFILSEEGSEEETVVFGKCGKQLFNLDVRHPFSVIQALTLALSTFDRKFVCE